MQEHPEICIDVETTGLIPEVEVPGKRPRTTKKEKVSYETGYMDYPHIVSIAWKVDDEETKYFILNQEGRKIPQASIDIHGITDEMAEKSEDYFHNIISMFIADAIECDIVIGHGLYFDTSMIKASVLRDARRILPHDMFEQATKALHKNKRIDTMQSACTIMRGWKELSALHMKIFRNGFPAHNAKEDCEAGYRCYQWLKRKNIVPSWEKLQERKNG